MKPPHWIFTSKSPLFVTADWHLGDERMEILGRPFSSAEENFEVIRDNVNSVVAPDDQLIVNGDILYKGADPDIWLPRLNEIHGKKILIRGNHDAPFTGKQLAPYVEKVVKEGHGIFLASDYHGLPVPVFVTHYPTRAVTNAFNLVGHVHSVWKYQLNALNVGVDVHHFRPVSMKKLVYHFQAICEFYDEDAWVAYHESNTHWRGKRGKEGRYFLGTGLGGNDEIEFETEEPCSE